MNEDKLRPIVEALIYLADEPVTLASMIELLGEENEAAVRQALSHLRRRYASPEHGIEIKEIADGYKMATKPEHHAWVQKFLKHHTPPIRLSLPGPGDPGGDRLPAARHSPGNPGNPGSQCSGRHEDPGRQEAGNHRWAQERCGPTHSLQDHSRLFASIRAQEPGGTPQPG